MPYRTWTAHTLPFDKLSAQDFERMCLWLVRREGFSQAEHLGASGGDQGRDIVAWRDGRRFVFQCKRVRAFNPTDAEREVRKIRSLAAGRPDEIVFIITCNVSASARRRAQDAWGNESTCHFWVGTELDERVKKYPDLLLEFFGGSGSDQGSAVLGNWSPHATADATQGDPPSWPPLVVHALLPAPKFFGRQDVLQTIESWTDDLGGPPGVLALIAVGGTGKTAVIERLLHRLGSKPRSGGLLVWSFYENPQTEEFLQVACGYFGRVSHPGRSPSFQLQRALDDGRHHLMILDGLESVQGQEPYVHGSLEDQELKIFLRRAASGLGKARVLVTSRFPLSDLQPWEGRGYSKLLLDDLDPASARAVLAAWGVRGKEEALDSLANSVGCHALSLTILGSYLATYCDGDPGKFPGLLYTVKRLEDPTAARLAGILSQYTDAMPKNQRDLLAVLSIFPRGATTDTLSDLAANRGDAIGAIAGLDRAELLQLLTRLKRLGLISDLPRDDEVFWQSHPFVRDFMKELLPLGASAVHEVLRAQKSLSLSSRPASLPMEKRMLDQYEELIEHTRAAGRTSEAFQLYWHAMGHYDHMGRKLGEFARGMRIIARFSLDGSPSGLDPKLSLWERLGAVSTWSLFARHVGDLPRATEASEENRRLAEDYVRIEFLKLFEESCGEDGFLDDRSFDYRLGQIRRQLHAALANLAHMYCDTGRLPEALAAAERSVECVRHYVSRGVEILRIVEARALHLLGRTAASRSLFQAAQAYSKLDGLDGIWAAEHYLDCEAPVIARDLALGVLDSEEALNPDRTLAAPKAHLVLGRVAVAFGDDDADRHLADLQDWAERSGDSEAALAAHLLAAEIAFSSQRMTDLLSEASAGVHLAKTTGFRLYEIQHLAQIARGMLSRGEAEPALALAREISQLSEQPSCAYAWGMVAGMELAGASYDSLGQKARALEVLENAERLRGQMRISDE
jgi:hypothetical protein